MSRVFDYVQMRRAEEEMRCKPEDSRAESEAEWRQLLKENVENKSFKRDIEERMKVYQEWLEKDIDFGNPETLNMIPTPMPFRVKFIENKDV